MGRIFYGCSGEGLGHASRTLSVIDHMPDAEIHVFTFGKALKFFQDMGYPYIHPIAGIPWSYKNNSVDYIQSGITAYDFFTKHIRANLNLIKSEFKTLKPKLFVADFEPSIPRAAHIQGCPLVSLDNQHYLDTTALSPLPWFLKIYGAICGITAKFYVPGPHKTIVSTFHADCCTAKQGVVLTNGLLRRNVEMIEPTAGDHILVYIRDSVSDKVLTSIESLPYHFKIYGASEGAVKDRLAQKPNMNFLQLSPAFIWDLASCRSLIATAGNQLLTEAKFYGKSCLLIPEPKQYEQAINVFYAELDGFARGVQFHELNKEVVGEFIETFRNVSTKSSNGVNTVSEVLRDYL